MPAFTYGAFAFTFSGTYSGYGPKEVRGPERIAYVVEHQIPAREGGIIEYLGSQQSTYQLRGFIVQQETGGSTANLVLSGNSYLSVNADDAKDFLKGMRGSGVQLLLIESTYSMGSGYQNLYENGFFQIEKLTLALEAGRGYPYYPYALDFRGATPSTYGNSSGTTTFSGQVGGGMSGYIFAFFLNATNGPPAGQIINTLGVFVNSVASGNLKVAVYSGTITNTLASGGNSLAAQSASQAVHSGWNYFPIRPSFQTVSGNIYVYAVAGDATSSSGYVLLQNDDAAAPTNSSIMSGVTYATAFPSTFAGLSGFGTSGLDPNIVMVAGV